MGIREFWAKVNEKNSLLGTGFYIVLGFAIAIGANWGLGFALHTDTPVVAVFSNSMVPEFSKGDMIIVSGPSGLSVGDIVVYDNPNYKYPIIHRVIEIKDGKVRTKGDNNASPDPWETPISNVHGKAVFEIPYLGWVKVGVFEALGLAKE